ncbi:MAG: hypothetical protein HKP10_09630 [Kiritimatiellales bacterium]|nr:hypothetical protein [Kiritimatiellales bacterium]
MIGFWLAFGKYSLLYKLFFQLPLVSNIRAPIKFLDNFQICLGIVSAYGLDRLLAERKSGRSTKALWLGSAVSGVLLLLACLKVLVFPASRKAAFAGMGFERFADVMVQNMAQAWFHAALLAFLCGALVFVAWKGLKQAKWIGLAFLIVLTGDSLLLTSHYFRANDLAGLKQGNAVTNFLKQNQGSERTFFVDQSGIYNQWLASDGPYHGLNLFNIWQMPRMPVDYNEYLGTVGRNQVRLWELTAVKYVAAPAQILQQLQQNPTLGQLLRPALNYQVPTAQGMRPDVLLEFTGAIPRLALFSGWESVPLDQQCHRLADAGHNPRNTVLLDPAYDFGNQTGGSAFQRLNADEVGRSVTVSVSAQERSIVRFSQYFQPTWRAFVDGKPTKILRVDYLCMGVAVEPGEHIVEFRCAGGGVKVAFLTGALSVSLVLGVLLIFSRSRGAEA